jgi:acetyl-CoA carboxylase biotin carboxyl carrier protein
MASSPKASADPLDARLVRTLADILTETGLSEIEVERDGLKVRVARQVTVTATVTAPHAVAAPQAVAESPATPAAPVRKAGDAVNSPMVGTVYLQPQPSSPSFIKVGDMVQAGQTLMIIEAMKTMNPIPAPRAGKVVEILVSDAQPVEFGEPLVVIE